MNYAEWRSELHSIQLEIDKFDESYPYDEGFDIDKYNSERKPLVDKLEAHYKLEATCV